MKKIVAFLSEALAGLFCVAVLLLPTILLGICHSIDRANGIYNVVSPGHMIMCLLSGIILLILALAIINCGYGPFKNFKKYNNLREFFQA